MKANTSVSKIKLRYGTSSVQASSSRVAKALHNKFTQQINLLLDHAEKEYIQSNLGKERDTSWRRQVHWNKNVRNCSSKKLIFLVSFTQYSSSSGHLSDLGPQIGAMLVGCSIGCAKFSYEEADHRGTVSVGFLVGSVGFLRFVLLRAIILTTTLPVIMYFTLHK